MHGSRLVPLAATSCIIVIGVLEGCGSSGPQPAFNASTALPQTRASMWTETVLYSFAGGSDGANPSGRLVSDSTGALYGLTVNGGASNLGTAYKLTRAGSVFTESVLLAFDGSPDGANPDGPLTIDSHGNLYGTTAIGGLMDGSTNGTVFELSPSGSSYAESVLHSFGNPPDGHNPEWGVLRDATGALYGTAPYGGAYNKGMAFKLTPTDSFYSESVLHSFKGGADDGETPWSGLIEDSSGNLYGTASAGGPKGNGAIFKLAPSGKSYTETLIGTFAQSKTVGSSPLGSLIAGSSGILYGATVAGGPDKGQGTIFALTPKGSGSYSQSVLYTFKGGSDGSIPQGPLLMDTRGNLYGATLFGGGATACSNGCGTIYELTQSGSQYREKILYAFQGGPGGFHPVPGLIAGPGGSLYGATSFGGKTCSSSSGTCGVVFQLSR